MAPCTRTPATPIFATNPPTPDPTAGGIIFRPSRWSGISTATPFPSPTNCASASPSRCNRSWVVSGNEADGTYGFRNYHNALLDNAFGNYRQVLKKVALSPVMGDFLNNVNNDKSAPNENFARELLQLFSVGTCELNPNGSLRGGACAPTYDNETVRSYAYALTGWTYPAGGATPWGCWPQGTHCRYYGGDMVAVEARHDTAARTLMSGVSLAAGNKAPAALEAVLDSLIAHPNTAPFIGKQLIQQLVSSNPSAAYIGRVSAAFTSGKYSTFGTGQRGDLAATVAAVLLDPEARSATVVANGGSLRDPVLMFTGVLRGLNGQSDGDALSWWWGEEMREHVFRPPSVFNFYPPDYPVAGTALVGPELRHPQRQRGAAASELPDLPA